MPLFFLPLGLAILLLLLQTVFIKSRSFIWLALSFLITFSLGIVSQFLWVILEYPMERLNVKDVADSDAIVVLSGNRKLAPGKAKIVEWSDPDRFFAGIELFRAQKAPKLLFTGGVGLFALNTPPEGNLYRKEAIGFGIPSTSVFTTLPVVNTLEEAKEIRRLLFINKSKSPRILLVTSAFHMVRAKRLFEKEGLIVEPFPVDFQSKADFRRSLFRTPKNWIPNASSLASSSRALREIMGRFFYQTW